MDSWAAINAERNAIAKVLEIAQNRPVPPPESISPLQKALVRKIRAQIKESNPGMDFVKVEMTARKMASWVEEVSNEASSRQLGNVRARKVIVPDPEIQADTFISEQDEGEQIFVREISPETDISKLSLGKTGKKAKLRDNTGNTVLVEGLNSPDGDKTLVTKESINGDKSVWLLFTANFKDAINESKPELKVFEKRFKTFVEETRKNMSDEEWKNYIRGKLMTSVNWKEDMKHVDLNKITSDQLLDILKCIMEPDSIE